MAWYDGWAAGWKALSLSQGTTERNIVALALTAADVDTLKSALSAWASAVGTAEQLDTKLGEPRRGKCDECGASVTLPGEPSGASGACRREYDQVSPGLREVLRKAASGEGATLWFQGE